MILKVIFANSVDPDQTAPLGAVCQGPHCLPVCRNRFEKVARIFSRRHKKMTFSDAGFLSGFHSTVSRASDCRSRDHKFESKLSHITFEGIDH